MGGQDLSGEVIESRYQIVERIAEGAMGVVYKGIRIKLDRPVAIKVMHAALPAAMSGRKRFEREAKLMAKIEHPHCVSIIDYGLHDAKPYVVMEFVRGRSLFDVIEDQGRFEVPRAIDVIRQILSGLAHAHEQGIIHRDIKPANIMITPKAPLGLHARILDFGLARALEGSASLSNGAIVGTPSYMAPEQCRGEKVDARADIYACGILLFEMLTGTKPFSAKDPISTIKKQIDDPPPRLVDVAPGDYGALEAVVARALAKSPADRFPTAVAMAEAIEGAATGQRGAERSSEPTAQFAASDLLVPDPSVESPPSSVSIPITVSSAVEAKAGGNDSSVVTDVLAALAEKADASPAVKPLAPDSWVVAPDPSDDSSAMAASSADDSSAVAADSSAAREPVSQTRYIVIAGALVVVAAIALVVVLATGSSNSSSRAQANPTVAPGSAELDTPAEDPATDVVASASELAASGKLEPAIEMLVRARKAHPDSVLVPLTLGRLYFSKAWWNDGLLHLREAMRLDPQLRSDPELLKLALRGFVTTPAYDERLAKFLSEIGEPMIPLLEETASTHPKYEVRTRATTLLRKLRR